MKKYNFLYLLLLFSQVINAQEDFFDDVIDDIVDEPEVKINHYLIYALLIAFLIAFRFLKYTKQQLDSKSDLKSVD